MPTNGRWDLTRRLKGSAYVFSGRKMLQGLQRLFVYLKCSFDPQNLLDILGLIRYLLNYLLNYLLSYFLITPRRRVLLEKLTGSQPFKKFPAFYES